MQDPLESIFESLPDNTANGMVLMLVTLGEKSHLEARRAKRDKKHPQIITKKFKNKLAKNMREHPTNAEKVMRDGLIERKIRFENQRVILGYIADFYFSTYKLVVEIDGSVHAKQKEYDEFRDHVFRSNGFYVLRFTNERTVTHLDAVISEILQECTRIANIKLPLGPQERTVFIEDPKMKPRKGKYRVGEKPAKMRWGTRPIAARPK